MSVPSSTRLTAVRFPRCTARCWRHSAAVASLALAAAAWPQSPPDPEAAPLDEIIVTARRIEEPLRSVPMSVQVLPGEWLADGNTDNLYDLQYYVPGLVVNTLGGFGAGFALRGVTDQGGTSLSVATHVNGVFLGDANLALGRLFDLDRVEVLKGPQGTLYGRNATGGSINFFTRRPQPEYEAAFETSYGSFETARVDGSVNLPHGGGALRLAVAAANGDGFIRNTVDDRRFAEDDFWGFRGAWRLTGVERLDLTLTAERIVDDGGRGELWLPNPEFLPNPSDVHLTTVTLAEPFLYTSNDIVSLDIDIDLGGATLRSITGFASSHVNYRDDCAGMPILRDCVREILPSKYRQRSQEIHLASTGDDRVQWLVGANRFAGDEAERFFQFTPARNPLPSFNSLSNSDTDASALFGQITLRFAGRWAATGGLRYSHEDRGVTSSGTGTEDNPTPVSAGGDWDQVSWRADLSYTSPVGTLWYAGISTGFKSGGVTTQRLADGAFNAFDPEELTAYTVGVKAQTRGRRFDIDAAVFFYDFKNLQVQSVIFDGDSFIAVIENAAEAEIYGLDLAAGWQLSERWALDVAAVWLPRREYSDFRVTRSGGDFSGNKVTRAPEWTAAMTVEYQRPLADLGTISGRLEHHVRSAHFFTKENNPISAQGSFGLVNLVLKFENSGGRWYLFAAGRNLTDQDYFHQVFLQAAPGPPRNFETGVGMAF